MRVSHAYVSFDNILHLTFLTNNFMIPAQTIAKFYKCRWQIEIFFKWIKQHLRIKLFYGTSENAVKTQIWIAVSVYVLIAIIKKRFDPQLCFYTILQIFSVTAFEQLPIIQILTSFSFKNQTIDSWGCEGYSLRNSTVIKINTLNRKYFILYS